MLHTCVHRCVTGAHRNTNFMAQRVKALGRSSASPVRHSVRICQHPFPTSPSAPRTSPELRPNNEMLIGFIAASNLKKPSQKSPLLQTHPSKRDISRCFCKAMPRQGSFCCKRDALVTEAAAPARAGREGLRHRCCQCLSPFWGHEGPGHLRKE